MQENRIIRNQFRKWLLLPAVFVLLLFGRSLTAHAAMYQDAVKSNQIPISWDVPYSSNYTIHQYHIIAGTDNSHIRFEKTVPGTQTSCTVTGVSPGGTYFIKVSCDCTSAQTGVRRNGLYVGTLYTAQTLPAKVSGLKVDNYSSSMKNVTFTWSAQAVSGYEWILKDADNRTVDHAFIDVATTMPRLFTDLTRANNSYTFQVRGYARAANSYDKSYGPWSNPCHFVAQPQMKGSRYTKISGGKAILQWFKVKGATQYCIYMSTTQYGKYKKVATVSGKKSKVKIKKLKGKKFKSSTRYYVYVVAVKKTGGKTYYSPSGSRWYL